MASISKTPAGYRVQLYVKGVRDSGTFRTRREADAWAARRTTEMQAEAKKSPAEKTTLKQLLARYRDEVTPDKRGRRWEEIRLNRFCREKEKPARPLALPCTEITPEHIGEWRDARRNQVQASTNLRELSLLSPGFTHARLEWRLLESNPVTNVRKPGQKDHRTVTIKAWQVRRMLKQMGYRWGRRPATVGQAVAYVFLFALRTGMRAGEICNLTLGRVYADYCETPHKGGATVQSVRTVPHEHAHPAPAAQPVGNAARLPRRPGSALPPVGAARDRPPSPGCAFHRDTHPST